MSLSCRTTIWRITGSGVSTRRSKTMILVTGATGNVGHELVPQLLDLGQWCAY